VAKADYELQGFLSQVTGRLIYHFRSGGGNARILDVVRVTNIGQQGVNGARKQARRSHWLSEGLKSFVDDPHAAIEGVRQGEIKRLDNQARSLEQNVSGPCVEELITHEFESSHAFGGRSVFGWEAPPTSDAGKGEAKASNAKRASALNAR
jgi:hypothetical protein